VTYIQNVVYFINNFMSNLLVKFGRKIPHLIRH
jgi:hypothetical protein